jgi:hypothetical protein
MMVILTVLMMVMTMMMIPAQKRRKIRITCKKLIIVKFICRNCFNLPSVYFPPSYLAFSRTLNFHSHLLFTYNINSTNSMELSATQEAPSC